MSIDYNIFTNVGSRSVNEDSVRVSKKDGAFCFVLCDGLGGHGKGELASACVADYIRNLFLESYVETAKKIKCSIRNENNCDSSLDKR